MTAIGEIGELGIRSGAEWSGTERNKDNKNKNKGKMRYHHRIAAASASSTLTAAWPSSTALCDMTCCPLSATMSRLLLPSGPHPLSP